MDWLQFVASIVGSLAWPSIVALLLWLLRDQLSSLAGRVEEITLPGGAKAKFERKLEEGRVIVEEEAVEGTSLPAPDNRSLEIAREFPEAAVMIAFKEIEQELIELRQVFNLPPRSNLPQIVNHLVKEKMIDQRSKNLFDTLREARNAAAHAGRNSRLSPGEALEYTQQANVLVGLLKEVKTRL